MAILRALCSRRSVSLLAAMSIVLSGCAAVHPPIQTQRVAEGEQPIELGAPVRDNVTPMEASLACFARSLALTGRQPPVIGVGEVKDFTGRYSINEGNVVTQGGALMLISALGKLGGTVRVAERFDPAVAERELAYMDRRQLGNGQPQQVNGQTVPWLPYFGGTIQSSDFYIVGGITEVNYNISSGGAEASLNNIGIKRRTYTQSVALDLRVVDSKTLLVVDAISLSKQFTGYEVGANTFRFFGLDLFDINVGSKAQEPLQLGIRTAIEEAAIRLVARVAQVDPKPCLSLHGRRIETVTSEELFRLAALGKAPDIVAAAAGRYPDNVAGPNSGASQSVRIAKAAKSTPKSAQPSGSGAKALRPTTAAATPGRSQAQMPAPVPQAKAVQTLAQQPAVRRDAELPALEEASPAAAMASRPGSVQAPRSVGNLAVIDRPPSPQGSRAAVLSPVKAPPLAVASSLQASQQGKGPGQAQSAKPVPSSKPPQFAPQQLAVQQRGQIAGNAQQVGVVQAPRLAVAPTASPRGGGTASPGGPLVPSLQSAIKQPGALNSPAQGAAAAGVQDTLRVEFEFADARIAASSLSTLDRIALLARRAGGLKVMLMARDNENLDPAQRSRVLDKRINAFIAALAARGIPGAAIEVTWRPESTDFAVYRNGPGTQVIARLTIEANPRK